MTTRRAVISALVITPVLAGPAHAGPGNLLAQAARRQVGVTTSYDPAYRRLAYPNGDVPRDTGVCADVVVRAARDAWGLDLQRLVHDDMARAFSAYPKAWGLRGPDSNIDHRRVLNLETYWARQGAKVWQAPSRVLGAEFPKPLAVGDFLTWRLAFRSAPHVAIVVAVGNSPRIVQNIGGGTREDPLSTMWPHAAMGHYRWSG
jgi:uncharacterized protein